MLFGEQRLFPGAVSPLFWDPGPTAVDFSCRTQNVVAVLISLLGKSNQCERSFFLFWTEVWSLCCFVFCLLKPVKYCILLRVDWESDRWMREEEEGDDKKNGTFGSSLRGSGGFLSFKLLTDVSYWHFLYENILKRWRRKNWYWIVVYHL